MPNVYAVVDDLKERLAIGENDSREGQLLDMLESASRWVDQQTGHRFYTVSETRYYNALDRSLASAAWNIDTLERPWGSPQRIEIDDVLSVSQVATDENGDGTYERVWSSPSDYWLGPRNAPARGQPYRYLNRNAAVGRYLFPLWEESISITGTFGWCALAAVPQDVTELTLQVAEWIATTLTDLNQAGVKQYAIGQELSVSAADDALGASGMRIL